jgi:hypothetical protein
VCVEVVGYLLEELRDAKNYALFQTDVQTANIFIGSLIFIEELAEKVDGARCGGARRRRGRGPRGGAVQAPDAAGARAQIVETVTPVRDQLDACLVFPSMPAVMCAARARAARAPGRGGRRMHALGAFGGGALTRGGRRAQAAEQAGHVQPGPAGAEQEPVRGVHARAAQEQRKL